ncbi:bifunctional [glutamine synthetase] adenylyltransferase/[glutamine synthetase]-adenylyl-L-tyrosine phosphorylase [Microbacterium sp. STN6]|uniref:bifunctional [glutamine synthetase] adenylyltransferase/[glutamine synthetase]-adenylyl-L-tyrosine phosphorylase n=1 Tax=Microbacterium sp. STN6 TaxID=2995588 RepID=UPI002260E984|nr:bifunctional [glutamine synthetase] adenylyltransferase/[glutamine synthetase]-adenylyl-L-tyrosine phosphorylase [Microbacterium sp. STN6]MCX7522417.1 bifunctional [glutamine synthetase] adenylyltransferase/[glutamine synthetase]-adenylyl-L-tyrosine phosphorylase [Microbacterium sp. STN6]
MAREQTALSTLAAAGFARLSEVRERLAELTRLTDMPQERALELFRVAADADQALDWVLQLLRFDHDAVAVRLGREPQASRLVRLLGASDGLAEFLVRHPDELAALDEPLTGTADAADLRAQLLDAVGVDDVAASAPVAALREEEAWSALRVRYRRLLTQLAVFDLEQDDQVEGVDLVARSLADLAAGAMEASLAVARGDVIGAGPGHFSAHEVSHTRFAIIGMGKAGAGELNYVSDVDVIFVAEGDEEAGLSNARAVDVATRLAVLTMRGLSAAAIEPGLWEVDANLRPEGKDGALVRSLESHVAYYERWAKNWEFQALIKARGFAGDAELGRRYVDALAPLVWDSSSRENFVDQVQRMRERVTDNIPDDELDYQLKLGPGGLRDIEFTVQLLQLVHGQTDDAVRQRSTLGALDALAGQGYIGRSESAEFDRDYRTLRLLEHRLQLRSLTRTHLMPRDEADMRVLARATGLAVNAAGLTSVWSSIKQRVRGLHERLFYRPLLSAVAATPSEEFNLTSAQAEARLAAIGFRDPAGALVHIRALTTGVSRRASIQQHLLPVMLQWFADGADPDYGLVTFRRLSEDLGSTHWFLRMLRDSSGAAQRLTRVLAGSRFVGELLGRIPEGVAWLESDADLRPRAREVLSDEVRALLARHHEADAAAAALRTARRREVLRLAFAAILGSCTVEELARGLTDIAENVISGALAVARRTVPGADALQFAVIGMGRLGGRELGLGSDADVLYVFRSSDGDAQTAAPVANAIVAELVRLTADPALPLDLDAGLRPEGKNGPVSRSLDAYRAYYSRWSLTWEAQALLRARGIAGDDDLRRDFELLADSVRYPEGIDDAAVREVKRIKARVESERLPQAADPSRHLKLGRGSLSDVEWLVQLQQLQHAWRQPALRTPSTLDALAVCVESGLIRADDADRLREAWIFASRARSAMTLWTNKTADVLPVDRQQLEGVARLLEYPPGSASRLEEDYLAVTRRARSVFERLFYPEVVTP